MFSFAPRKRSGPVGARGFRAYGVGDIHGRLDLLDELLAKIEADLKKRPARKVLLVFVGDLIDRGPSSAQVIERLRTYRRDGVQTMFLLGNHEEVLLRVVHGEAELIEKWCSFGGTECLQSYGVETARLATLPPDEALDVVRKAIPKTHIEFLESFHDSCRFGDYLFVHAGIRPGVEIEQQKQSDLRWIREAFLFDDTDHGFVVVHGHTISETAEVHDNRIAIDTGAYRSDVLTAVAIERDQTWFLDTRRAEAGRPA